MEQLTLDPIAKVSGEVNVPGSKSLSNRALLLAALAEGETEMKGIGELKVKESDRIFSMAKGLRDCGVDVLFGDDYMTVKGMREVRGGQIINTFSDHRIAMSFMCLGQVTQKPIEISESASIDTSFPGFVEKFKEIGANL